MSGVDSGGGSRAVHGLCLWESTGFVVCTSDPLFRGSLACVLQPFSPFHQPEGVEESQDEGDEEER